MTGSSKSRNTWPSDPLASYKQQPLSAVRSRGRVIDHLYWVENLYSAQGE